VNTTLPHTRAENDAHIVSRPLSLSPSLSLPRLEAALAVADRARSSYRCSALPLGVATSDDRTRQALTAHSLLVIVM
jgi:hypothetical protein